MVSNVLINSAKYYILYHCAGTALHQYYMNIIWQNHNVLNDHCGFESRRNNWWLKLKQIQGLAQGNKVHP